MTVALSGMTLYTDNDNEANWSSNPTDGPDDYNNAVQGANSESWNVGKNVTETGVLTKSAALTGTRSLFMFWMSSNLAPYYTSIDLELESSAGNHKNFECANSTNKAIGGIFVPSVVDYINKGTDTGTFVAGSFTVLRMIVDNSASGNIRAVVNNWIDAMYYGPGHTISGTTVGDKLFDEAAGIDNLLANKYGIIWNYNDEIFCQGDLSLTGTALTSNSETLVFVDTVNGYDTYEFDGTGTATFTNTFIKSSGAIDYNFDMSGMTAFTMSGGGLLGYLTAVFTSGQNINNALFQDGGTATIPNILDTCTFNQCGKLTVTGSLSTCTLNKSTATEAVTVSNTNLLDGCIFIKDTGVSHAVELTGAADAYAWNGDATGYDAGSATDAVQVTGGSITGNETIHITAATGTFIINVADGATVPSVSSAGAIVNVVAGEKDFKFTLNPSITSYEWRVFTLSIANDFESTKAVLAGEESATLDNQTITHSFSNQPIAIQILPMVQGYEETIEYYTLTAVDSLNNTINLTKDINA